MTSRATQGERFLKLHILPKYFAGRLTDVFYSIHKAAIFNTEKLILGITGSRYIESLWLKGKLFPFLTSRIRSYFALSSLDASSCV